MGNAEELYQEVLDRAQAAANARGLPHYVFPVKYAWSGWGFTAYPGRYLDIDKAIEIMPAA